MESQDGALPGLLLEDSRGDSRLIPTAEAPVREPGADACTLRVVIAEDNLDDAELMVHELTAAGLRFTWERVDTEAAFTTALMRPADLVLCDHTLPQFGARRAFEILRELNLRIPVVMVSGTISDDLAIEFMQQGAYDYVLKDRLARLGPAVRNALDRYRFESEATLANQRLDRLMDELEVGAVVTDGRRHVVSCNDVVWRMLGYRSAAAFRALEAPIHFADPKRYLELFELLGKGGMVRGFEVEFRRQDGSTLWTTGQYSAITDSNGEVIRVEALLVDSTDRHRAEEEMRTSRARLDSALRNAPIVMATVDRDLRFTFAGGTSLERVGLNTETMIGLSVRDLVPDRPDIIGMLERAVGGDEFDEEGELGGHYFHVRFSPIPAAEEHGGGAALVAVDITARHDAELKVEARERQQAAARKLAEEALSDVPTAELMQFAVRLAASTLGVEMAAIHQLLPGEKQIRKMAHVGYARPEPVVQIVEGGLISRVMQGSAATSIEDYGASGMACPPSLAREGATATMSTAIRDEKRVFGFLSVHSHSPRHWTGDEREFLELMGKTLWVEVERQRLQAEHRQLVSRLVNAREQERQRIAGDVHDDAVQVMSAVTMRLHLLAQHLADPEHVALVAKLQSTVALAIERLRSLLFQLNPPALERHGLGTVLSTLLDEFQRDFGILAEFKNELAADPGSAAGLVVYRIVQESLTNVHKHAGARRVVLSAREADGGLLVSVEDDGRGFDAAETGDIKHIGLSAMRERAELAGGWWELVTAPGSGTLIRFWIPAEPRTLEEVAS